MLMIEGGTAVAIFVRCFTDARGLNRELVKYLHFHFPRGVLAAICVLLVLLTAYGSAALGQLFFFHVVLIRKGMRTYDYIMAMKEENALMEEDMSEDDSDLSSDESIDLDSPEKTRFAICRERIPELRIRQPTQRLRLNSQRIVNKYIFCSLSRLEIVFKDGMIAGSSNF